MSGRAQLFSRITAATIFVGSLWAVSPTNSLATLYECQSASGETIFTDSPAQLQSCKPLKSTSTAPSESAPSASPSRPNVRRPQRAQPSQVRPPGPPTQRRATVQRRAQRQRGQQASRSRTSPTSGPQAKAAEQGQCTSAVNPLNPLLTVPCPPAAKPK